MGFTVVETSKVAEIHVIKSDQPSLNQEAVKIVSGMPDWRPGKQRGVAVPVRYSVPVRFGDAPSAEEIVTAGTNVPKKPDVCPAKEEKPTRVVPDFQVSGTVVDEQGRVKPGVSIYVPNTTCGAITDINGRFSLKAKKGSDLMFSFIGYKSQRVPAAATVFVRMEQEVVNLQATVTEQFGRSKNTSSVSVVKGINLYGVKEGEPLLYIVNGKEVSKEYLSTIETERIKSISILKNESGTEIYGDKGKNGVIIITLYTEDEFQARKKNAEE